MGCAPSIHVSQSGIVYCREERREGSSARPNRASSLSEVVGHIQSSESSTSSSSKTRLNQASKKSQNSTRASSIEVETQTSEPRSMEEIPKKGRREIMFGPMKLYQNSMQITLVFAKEDSQTDALIEASKLGSYSCKLCKSSESAMEHFLQNQPDAIIIDMRSNTPIDGEKLCRNIRATRPSENCAILAVVKGNSGDDVPSVLPLLKAGFNRQIVENHNERACLNELMMLEHGDVQAQSKLRATACLFSAIEHAYDSIEITCIDPELQEYQYVNPAFEKITGYMRSEVIGNSLRVMQNSEINKPVDAIHSQLKKGKSWEGTYYARRKNGEQFKMNCHIVPIIGQSGKVTHHVAVKRDVSAINAQTQQVNMNMNVNMHVETQSSNIGIPSSSESKDPDAHSIANGIHRKQSMTSAKIEAPITKVINMLNAAQENSPSSVVQALDKVVEILKTAELYSPFNTGGNQSAEEEEIICNDLVGGLISNGRRRFSGAEISSKSGHSLLHKEQSIVCKDRPHHLLSEVPQEVLMTLYNDEDWDFNIIKLEKACNYKPLYYLGLKIFNRFRVCEFLNISEDMLGNWLHMIESNYHAENAYHNSTHAADVLHATAAFVSKERVNAVLEPLDVISSLIAAVVHDVDHPGYTNAFLCNAGNELAVLYNDLAVLESHHAALAFKLTSKSEKSNIFQELDMETFRAMRQSIIDMVMATEMTKHFEHLSKFVNSINKRRSSSMDEVHSLSGRPGTPESTTSSQTMVHGTPENRTLIKRMLIKCADICNPAKPRDLCRIWAERISEEYFRQTDEERRLSLPVVMPVFDRSSCNVPRSQVWFIDYFVSDLYDAWDAFAEVPETIKHLQNNYDWWKNAAEEIDAQRATGAAASTKDPRSDTSTSTLSTSPGS